ncbi:hypothetical protein T265_04786 [Opisthorchis viverrini]|uniref:Uncharacterized protein n=1 Tax=Opisthorchis viverrini TaxID=6198 RepID=A0A074ZYD0_OPIVI|nr:hypothetical protein T265_04786 [Opisthorchis viverrini]KER28325.1 hypothetical protein T265_04786 [Opisthorchis viverrini]
MKICVPPSATGSLFELSRKLQGSRESVYDSEASLFNTDVMLSMMMMRESVQRTGGEMAQWSKRKFTDRKVRASNTTSASRPWDPLRAISCGVFNRLPEAHNERVNTKLELR